MLPSFFTFYYTLQTTEASPYSCEASAKTVKKIDKCPENEEGWQKAAAIKNCSKYAHQCDNPDKFVYHCAVNPYINETLEVCAIQKTIVRGKKILGSTKIL